LSLTSQPRTPSPSFEPALMPSDLRGHVFVKAWPPLTPREVLPNERKRRSLTWACTDEEMGNASLETMAGKRRIQTSGKLLRSGCRKVGRCTTYAQLRTRPSVPLAVVTHPSGDDGPNFAARDLLESPQRGGIRRDLRPKRRRRRLRRQHLTTRRKSFSAHPPLLQIPLPASGRRGQVRAR